MKSYTNLQIRSMNGCRNIQIIFYLLSAYLLAAQERQLWIGDNLTEISYDSGKWFYNTEKELTMITEVGNDYFISSYPDEQILYKIHIEQIGIDIDTIILRKDSEKHLFVKPYLRSDNNFDFESLEYAIIGEWNHTIAKYTLNSQGVLRKSSDKNDVVIEKTLSSQELNNFEQIYRKIDIRNMGRASGAISFCDYTHHSFTFRDSQGVSYSYFADRQRSQLALISGFLTNVEGMD